MGRGWCGWKGRVCRVGLGGRGGIGKGLGWIKG